MTRTDWHTAMTEGRHMPTPAKVSYEADPTDVSYGQRSGSNPPI